MPQPVEYKKCPSSAHRIPPWPICLVTLLHHRIRLCCFLGSDLQRWMRWHMAPWSLMTWRTADDPMIFQPTHISNWKYIYEMYVIYLFIKCIQHNQWIKYSWWKTKQCEPTHALCTQPKHARNISGVAPNGIWRGEVLRPPEGRSNKKWRWRS